MRRINLGCGPDARPGWINCDLAAVAGAQVRCDVRRGLPFAGGSIDCIAAIHLIQDLSWNEIPLLLAELHRVLRPGGRLRLGVPDLDKAIAAYLANDARYFYVPDAHARSIGAKLVTQIIWYGSVRTPCNFGALDEWLRSAGFVEVLRRSFGESDWPELVALDNRQRESLFVEAEKSVSAQTGGAGPRCRGSHGVTEPVRCDRKRRREVDEASRDPHDEPREPLIVQRSRQCGIQPSGISRIPEARREREQRPERSGVQHRSEQ